MTETKGNWWLKPDQLDVCIYHGLALKFAQPKSLQTECLGSKDRSISRKYKMIDTALWNCGACLKNNGGFHLHGPLLKYVNFHWSCIGLISCRDVRYNIFCFNKPPPLYVKIWWSTSLCEWWGDTLHLGVVFGSRMSASLGHSKEKKIVTSIVSKQELWCIYNFQAMLVITYFGFFGQKNNLFWIVIQWFVNLPIYTKVSNWVVR